MKQVLILREVFTATQTIGRLFVNGEFVCYTLEGQARPDGVRIAESPICIPEGAYTASASYSTMLSRKRSERTTIIKVQDVPGFSLIRIFGGAPDPELTNSIRVGKGFYAEKDVVSFSSSSEDELLNILGKETKESHILSIVNTKERKLLRPLTELDASTGYQMLVELGSIQKK